MLVDVSDVTLRKRSLFVANVTALSPSFLAHMSFAVMSSMHPCHAMWVL